MKLVLLSNGTAVWVERELVLSTQTVRVDVLNMPPGAKILCNGNAELRLRNGTNHITVHSKTQIWRAEPLLFVDSQISVKSILATEEVVLQILEHVEMLMKKTKELEKVSEEHQKAIFGNQLF